MTLNEACVILERQAKWDGVGLLELLETVNKYGVREYIKSAELDQEDNDEFGTAFHIFMKAGREFFSPRV